MKKDYDKVLKYFSEAKTRDQSEKYLKKYWLTEDEWSSYWRLIKNNIFCPESKHLPEMMFKDEFELIPLLGGLIFAQKDFLMLQKCMQEVGDKFFVIIENKHIQPIITGENDKRIFHPLLRFKFPVDVTWQELMNGGLVSFEVFEMSYKEYFIFGDGGHWGKYVANEYWDQTVNASGTPLDIIGFKQKFSDLFRKNFEELIKNRQQILKWLPEVYKKRINPYDA